MMTPSVDGMRFLPLAFLILAILWGEAAGRPIGALGYAVWLFSLAWSPEAGVYATIVWFPYLGLRAAQARGVSTFGSVTWAALRGGAVAGAALAAGIAILSLVFRAGFGDWPSASGFLTYILNPPGILPPNPLGPIWLIASALVIGAVALTRAEARELRMRHGLSFGTYRGQLVLCWPQPRQQCAEPFAVRRFAVGRRAVRPASSVA